MTINNNFSIDLNVKRELPTVSDFFAFSYISKKFTSWDCELFETKWFDYRHMSPLQATICYMKAYEVVFKRIYAQTVNFEVADYIALNSIEKLHTSMAVEKIDKTSSASPTKEDIKAEQKRLKARSDFSSYWRGRQIADALGMPYETYIDIVMSKRLRNWSNPYMPRPQHLYRDYEVEHAQDKWEELQASSLFLAEHPAYKLENFQDLPHQNAYHEWLFKQADLRADPTRFYARFVVDKRLPIGKVQTRLEGNDTGIERFNRNLREFQ